MPRAFIGIKVDLMVMKSEFLGISSCLTRNWYAGPWTKVNTQDLLDLMIPTDIMNIFRYFFLT